MGLIKATVDTIENNDEQWKEVIRCEEMTNDILMVKRKTQNGIIDNGTTIVVKPGQCVAVLKNGKVVDATAEPGTFLYDDSVMPTFKKGKFDKDFRKMWEELSKGNCDTQDECILYFNLNEIVDNKFNTSSPIELKNSNQNLTNCYGKYSLKISNPAVLMNKISGKSNVYRKGRVTENIKPDISNVFKSVLGELDNKQQINELSNKENKIRQIMQEKVLDDSIREKGFKVVSFDIEKASFSSNQNSSSKKIFEPISIINGTETSQKINKDITKNSNIPDNVETLQKQTGSENSFINPITDLNNEGLNNIVNYKISDIQDNKSNIELNNKSDEFLDLGFKYEEKANLVTDQLENLFADEDEIRNLDNEVINNKEFAEDIQEESQSIENSDIKDIGENTENNENIELSDESNSLNDQNPEFSAENQNDVETANNDDKINDEFFENSDINKNGEEIDFNDEETKRIDDELFKFNEVNNNGSEEFKENNDEENINIEKPQIESDYIENEKTQLNNDKDIIETINNEISAIEANDGTVREQDLNNNIIEEDTYKEENENQDIKSQLIDFENVDNSYNAKETHKEESVVNTENQVMVKMCLRCGTMNQKGAKTCVNCGNEL